MQSKQPRIRARSTKNNFRKLVCPRFCICQARPWFLFGYCRCEAIHKVSYRVRYTRVPSSLAACLLKVATHYRSSFSQFVAEQHGTKGHGHIYLAVWLTAMGFPTFTSSAHIHRQQCANLLAPLYKYCCIARRYLFGSSFLTRLGLVEHT